jgi:hypothetical protein
VLQVVLALIGSSAVSVGFGEWLRRRDPRASLNADLDVWAKLPDGPTKDQLMAGIEQRAGGLGVASRESILESIMRHTWLRWVVITLGTFTALVVLDTVLFIDGRYSWRRHSDGILWWHTPDGPWMTFQSAVLFNIGLPAVTAALTVVVMPKLARLIGWRQPNDSAEDEA